MLGGTAQGQGQLAYAPGRITYKTGRRRKNGIRGESAAFCQCFLADPALGAQPLALALC